MGIHRGISYWLMPSSKDAAYYQALIQRLCEQAGAVSLEPHVTLYVGRQGSQDDPEALLTALCDTASPLSLRVGAIVSEPVFGHSFYLKMGLSTQLERWCEQCRKAAQWPSDYALNPHLSLLYKADAVAETEQLAKTLTCIGQTIHFDRIQITQHPERIQGPADIAQFQVIGECKLA